MKLIALVVLLSLASCPNNIEPNVPDCIQELIKELEKDECNGAVVEYMFNGKVVYAYGYSYEQCAGADFASSVVDENCEPLCTLGGIAGLLECDGLVFADEAVFVRNVWEPKD